MTLMLLNAFDAFITLALIRHGLANEANPVMAAALNQSTATFLFLKIGGVTLLACLLLWVKADRTLLFLTAIYAIVALYHLKSLYLLATV